MTYRVLVISLSQLVKIKKNPSLKKKSLALGHCQFLKRKNIEKALHECKETVRGMKVCENMGERGKRNWMGMLEVGGCSY